MFPGTEEMVQTVEGNSEKELLIAEKSEERKRIKVTIALSVGATHGKVRDCKGGNSDGRIGRRVTFPARFIYSGIHPLFR
jgi:hypothetical protein